MRTNIASAQATARPNRILVILAAAWMVLSLAIGGAVTADVRAESAADTNALTVTATTP
jgi:hypothetical protein